MTFLLLSDDLRRRIYEFDSTYHEHYKRCVSDMQRRFRCKAWSLDQTSGVRNYVELKLRYVRDGKVFGSYRNPSLRYLTKKA